MFVKCSSVVVEVLSGNEIMESTQLVIGQDPIAVVEMVSGYYDSLVTSGSIEGWAIRSIDFQVDALDASGSSPEEDVPVMPDETLNNDVAKIIIQKPSLQLIQSKKNVVEATEVEPSPSVEVEAPKPVETVKPDAQSLAMANRLNMIRRSVTQVQVPQTPQAPT